MPDINFQVFDDPVESSAPAAPPPVRTRLGSPRLAIAAAAGGLFLVALAAFAYWHFAHQARWFVDTPLYTARTNISGNHVQQIHSTLFYGANGTYSATNIVYEYGKPPIEQTYTGSWRQDGTWVCLRMDWMRDKEFCNAFIKTDQGWIVLNRTDARTTPISLSPLTPPADHELAPPSPPANCTLAGRAVAHAASIVAFQSSTASSGQPCQAEVRTCSNGELSGSFENATCSAAIALPLPPKPHPKPHHPSEPAKSPPRP